MFHKCMFCRAELPTNDTLERFPVGRRVAFDSARGRLWAVCSSCHRWNLAPIEDRWEALEELDKLTSDRARLLSQTEHIALLRAEDIYIIRVGRARLVEEAWWRYGQELQRRRSKHTVMSYAGLAAQLAVMGVANVGVFWLGGNLINEYLRWRKFGKTAWRGQQHCQRCGASLKEISFKRVKHFTLRQTEAEQPVEMRLACNACGFDNSAGGFVFAGGDAERLLRRCLAYQHFSGASEKRVKSAVRAIDDAGSPARLIHQLSRTGYSLQRRKQDRVVSIALEIAVNDEVERQWLEIELADLESRWRDEEELAGIIDGELTPLPILERIRLSLPG